MNIFKLWVITLYAVVVLAGCVNATTDSSTGYPIRPINYDMIWIPAGSFEIGKELNPLPPVDNPSYHPDWNYMLDIPNTHQVTFSRGFWLGKHHVTQLEWKNVMGYLPDLVEKNTLFKGDDFPIYYISWYEAIEFCNRLSRHERLTPAYTIHREQNDPNNTDSSDPLKWLVIQNPAANGYCLPTEAQWEYAAKGANRGDTFTYSGSNQINNIAVWSGNSGGGPSVVGTRNPNGLGLFDMTGNVSEWCWDWYGNYISGAKINPAGAISGNTRVRRGGSWNDSRDIRSIYRDSRSPDSRADDIGFRVVKP